MKLIIAFVRPFKLEEIREAWFDGNGCQRFWAAKGPH